MPNFTDYLYTVQQVSVCVCVCVGGGGGGKCVKSGKSLYDVQLVTVWYLVGKGRRVCMCL